MMKTGEAQALETERLIVALDNKSKSSTEFVMESAEAEISGNEKIASNSKIRERFSRLKKSLRKRSVSIL